MSDNISLSRLPRKGFPTWGWTLSYDRKDFKRVVIATDSMREALDVAKSLTDVRHIEFFEGDKLPTIIYISWISQGMPLREHVRNADVMKDLRKRYGTDSEKYIRKSP